MAKKRIGQIDLGTRELLDGVVVYVARKRTNGFGKRWVAVGQEPVESLAVRRKELGEEGLAVFLMLMGRLTFNNHLVLNQAEIGRILGMHRQSVQRAIKRLMGMGVLLEGSKEGPNRSYQLNPEFGWKGSAKNHVKALDDHRKKRMKAANITGVVTNPAPDEETELK